MKFNFNDGGKAETGNHDEQNDCVARAISLAIGGCAAYGLARVMLSPLKDDNGVDVCAPHFTALMGELNMVYVPVPPHKFAVEDLPETGTYIAHTEGHICTVIDGTLQDTVDARNWLLKGYWIAKSKGGYNVSKGDKRMNLNPLAYVAACKMVALTYLNYDRTTLITLSPC